MIVNEFGEIGIDNDLVVDTDEEVFEMNNGCVCCTVRGRSDPRAVRPDAPPDSEQARLRRYHRGDDRPGRSRGRSPRTFFVDEEVRAKTRLDSVTTVVDARHILPRLKDSREAREQGGLRRPDRAEQDRSGGRR